MKGLKSWIRNYFSFTQRETNGFILLLLLLALVAVSPFLREPSNAPYDPTTDQQILDSLAAQLETAPYAPARRYTPRAAQPISPELLQPFDPNKTTQAQWEQFGLPAYVAERLIKYREKANGFTHKSQIARIYGFPPALFAQLAPYIQLPDDKPASEYPYPTKQPNRTYANFPIKEKPAFTKKTFRLTPFDINAADTAQLKKIRGIGAKLSARIVKFRDKLGGFRNMQQVAEVYGLTPETVDSLRKYTFVSEGFAPSKLNLNAVTLDQLRQHPYVGFNLARHIIAYRTQHGPFQTLDDLQKIKTIDAAKFTQLKSYFTL